MYHPFAAFCGADLARDYSARFLKARPPEQIAIHLPVPVLPVRTRALNRSV